MEVPVTGNPSSVMERRGPGDGKQQDLFKAKTFVAGRRRLAACRGESNDNLARGAKIPATRKNFKWGWWGKLPATGKSRNTSKSHDELGAELNPLPPFLFCKAQFVAS